VAPKLAQTISTRVDRLPRPRREVFVRPTSPWAFRPRLFGGTS
jgi:hypothetical protein